jgi:cell wall-associated NlpC family hydrolase
MNATKVSEQAGKYLNQPYFVGDKTKGYDCISLIWDFYESFGIKLPHEFEDLNEGNYAEAWANDPKRAGQVMRRYLMSIGWEIGKNFYKAGDLLVFEKEEEVFIGIYTGNGHLKLVFKQGVFDSPYHVFEKMHIATRRLL